jgi:hypothetical protein
LSASRARTRSAPVPTSPSRTLVSAVGAAMVPYYTQAAPPGRGGLPRGAPDREAR